MIKQSNLYPLCFFPIHGTFCCMQMHALYQKKSYIDYSLCYEAQSIEEANVILLFGSISKKLIEIVVDKISIMQSNRVIIHFKGCDLRVDNKYSFSSIEDLISIDIIRSECHISAIDKNFLQEIRQCLQA